MDKKILLKLICFGLIIIVFASFVYSVTPSDPDLIAFWKLDDSGAVMTDSKTNGKTSYPLYYSGSLNQQERIPSYSSNSLGFDATNHAENNSGIRLVFERSNAISYGCWVNRSLSNTYPPNYFATIMSWQTNYGGCIGGGSIVYDIGAGSGYRCNGQTSAGDGLPYPVNPRLYVFCGGTVTWPQQN
jgi:hypothetical protein